MGDVRKFNFFWKVCVIFCLDIVVFFKWLSFKVFIFNNVYIGLKRREIIKLVKVNWIIFLLEIKIVKLVIILINV